MQLSYGNGTVNKALRFVSFKNQFCLAHQQQSTIHLLETRNCVFTFSLHFLQFFLLHYNKQLDNKSFVGKVRVKKGANDHIFRNDKSERERQQKRTENR